MDSSILGYILAAVTGWGTGALFDRDPTDYPPRPCPKCPYPAGAVASLVLWALLGLNGNGDASQIVVPAVAVGIGGGLFGGSLSGFLGGLSGRRDG